MSKKPPSLAFRRAFALAVHIPLPTLIIPRAILPTFHGSRGIESLLDYPCSPGSAELQAAAATAAARSRGITLACWEMFRSTPTAAALKSTELPP